MSVAPSVTCSTTSTLNPESTNLQQYSFVQHSDNVNASSTRRAVRSHAMRAVRRQQRQESTKPFHLKWLRGYSPSETFQRTRPDEQSAGSNKQYGTPQFEEPILIQPQEGEAVGGTPSLDLSEPLGSLDRNDSLPTHFQSSISPPSEGTRSLYSLERLDLQPYATIDEDEETTPTFDHPQTHLSAGRLDPFQTSSIHINRSLAELIDHCVLASFHSYKAPTHLQLYAVVPLIDHRPYYHACNVLWRTMSQANSY